MQGRPLLRYADRVAQAYATAAEIVAFALAAAGAVVTVEQVGAWLPVAQGMTNLGAWGENASTAHTLRTLHYTTRAMAGPLGLAGPATAMANGPASWSFGSGGVIDGPLGTTLWGQMLADLIRIHGIPAVVANSAVRQGW